MNTTGLLLADSPAPQSALGLEPARAESRARVLLIEDNSQDLEILSDLIQQVADCKIDIMTTLEESPDWIQRSHYQLIVLALPGSHIAVLEAIKQAAPETAVILIVPHASVEEAVAAMRLGAEDYLGRPFNIDAFQLAVKRGLDRKAVFEENLGATHFLYLLHSCQMISASLSQTKIFEVTQIYLLRELQAGFSAIYSFHGGEIIRVDSLERNEGADRALAEVLDITLRASGSIPALHASSDYYRFVERGQLTPALFLLKFQCAGQADYYCACLGPSRPKNIEVFESRLRMLKAQIEVTGKNIEHYMGVQQLVYLDDATGLYNTRYLTYLLDKEVAQAVATHKSFAVLFIDADHFKAINDHYGHPNGTKLLNELGNRLKRYVRETDTIFRYGGDEFVAVLSPCDLETARIVAERIRSSIQKTPFLADESLSVSFTVSIGVALFPDHAQNTQAIIEAADQAMYQAKRQTRNSVALFADAPKAMP